jgi:hypothetical protein
MLNLFILGFFRVMLLINITLIVLGNLSSEYTDIMNTMLIVTLVTLIFGTYNQQRIVKKEQKLLKELDEYFNSSEE